MQETIDSTLRATLSQRSDRLLAVARELKAELFGIDDVIDRVIDSLRAWYVLPELISRPVIVCLWGLTGTGKTQLTRKLAQKLGFYDRFIEVQMDGFSHGSGYRTAGSVSAMLAESGIQEGEPGILVLDEFQRFRTVDNKGSDIKVERYQDVWALLSDGRLAPSLSFLGEIESTLAWSEYEYDQAEAGDKEKAKKKPKFRLAPYEAKELKRSLKLKESLLEIMAWEPEQLRARIYEFRGQQQSWETDYSKLLVFVSGNLDEMYAEMAKRVEDCDTDADIFHELTKKLSLIDVKKALAERFRPEQVARLGNNHVIYPSFNRATYERLVRSMCEQYVAEVFATSGVRFEVQQCVLEQIYANGVFPAQGTRPLFSSAHAILSSTLVNAALWALENGVSRDETVQMTFDAQRQCLAARVGAREQRFVVNLELNNLKQRSNRDFRAMLAVHEAGHGLVYGLLMRQAPLEIKINVASFEGGYNSYSELKAYSRRNCLDIICVSLAGRAAEALVFGDMACTTGAEQDYKQATAAAARYVRHYGFGQRFSRTDVTQESEDNLNTDVAPTNREIEALLAQEYARAMDLLAGHSASFLKLVDLLVEHGSVPKEQVAALLGLPVSSHPSVLEPYADGLDFFRERQQLLQKLGTATPSDHPTTEAGTSVTCPMA
jgi:cell division protease FtsH